MTHRKIGRIDMKTGEILDEGFVAYIVPKRKNGFTYDWIAMSQSASMLIAKSDLGANDLRVFMALVSQLDFENMLLLNQAEMARDLKMHRQHVQRSIKRLIEFGVILQGPRVGINCSYRFNPEFGWKGSSKNHVVSLKTERRKHEQRLREAGIKGVISGSRDAQERDPNA